MKCLKCNIECAANLVKYSGFPYETYDCTTCKLQYFAYSFDDDVGYKLVYYNVKDDIRMELFIESNITNIYEVNNSNCFLIDHFWIDITSIDELTHYCDKYYLIQNFK